MLIYVYMIAILFDLLLIITLIFIVVKPTTGICLYLIYMFLVPTIKIELPGFSIGELFTSIFLLFIVTFRNLNKIKKIDFTLFKPFFFLYIAQFIILFMGNSIPLSESLSAYVRALSSSIFIPLSLFIIINTETYSYKYIKRTMLVIIFMEIGYGLLLITMPGINPYMIMMNTVYGGSFDESYASDFTGGRLLGRISSFFPHPMMYGLFLGFVVLFIAFLLKNKLINKKIGYITITISVICILTCGVRTPIAALIVAISYYIYRRKNIKIFVYSIIGIVVIIGVLNQVPGLRDYIYSIFDSSSDKVSGSSLGMRLDQLQGCFDIIKENKLFGQGFGWNNYYWGKYGDHPILLAFESLIFVVLCNEGYVGALVWIFFSVYFIKKIKDNEINAMFVYYLSYAIITGESGTFSYLRLFLIFAIILLCTKKMILNNKIKYGDNL